MEIKQGTMAVVGIIGAIFAVAGLFVYLIWGGPIWLYTTLEVLAAIHLIVFFVTHFEMLKDISLRRSTQFGANSLLMIVIFVAILSVLNFILARHETRFDLSGTGAYTLAPQTVDILKNLKKEVKISGFFQEQSNVKDKAKEIFENYVHESPSIKYEMIDPDRRPAVAKQYGITEYDTVVLESGGQLATVRTISEAEITSALIRISRDKKKHFYFIEGHGEHAIDDTDRGGYSYLRDAITKQGFIVKKLHLLSEKKVPEDAAVVIVGGPQRGFTQEEQEMIDAYLTGGGRLFFMIDPLVSADIYPFLSKWGVRLEDDIILDPTSGLGGAIPIVNPGGYPTHDITNRFHLATFYPLSRSIGFDASKEGAFRFEPILQTGQNSWLTRAITGELSIDPKRDQKGPITIGGVILPKGSGPEVEGESGKKMRLVVIGDADFATNSVVRAAGNGDLFQNVVSWLAEEGDLVSIRPHEAQTSTLLLTSNQIKMTFYTSVLILPMTILVVGLSIWYRRRRL